MIDKTADKKKFSIIWKTLSLEEYLYTNFYNIELAFINQKKLLVRFFL